MGCPFTATANKVEYILISPDINFLIMDYIFKLKQVYLFFPLKLCFLCAKGKNKGWGREGLKTIIDQRANILKSKLPK